VYIRTASARLRNFHGGKKKNKNARDGTGSEHKLNGVRPHCRFALSRSFHLVRSAIAPPAPIPAVAVAVDIGCTARVHGEGGGLDPEL